MGTYRINLSQEKLTVLEFIAEDDTTSDNDFVNYYNQIINKDIPQETLEDNLCKELIGSFPIAISKAQGIEHKKRIFVQYYKILAVNAAYKNLIHKVGHLL